jgi:hypothetical protein
MSTRYQQLVLGLGQHEGSRLPSLVITGNFEDSGFDTWEEAVTHFRDCLVEVIREKALLAELSGCEYCTARVSSESERYCCKCGKRLPEEDDEDRNAEAAALFREWFDTELHQFTDHESMENLGWHVGTCMEPGGFVQIEAFDELLSEWDTLGDQRFETLLNRECVRLGEATIQMRST